MRVSHGQPIVASYQQYCHRFNCRDTVEHMTIHAGVLPPTIANMAEFLWAYL
jgi:hypothetical protein